MDASRWERVQSLFHKVSDLQDLRQQTDILRAECKGDETLVDEVLAMLAAEQQAPGLLDASVGHLAEQVLGDPVIPLAAYKEIGPYQIERVLGEGGMGTVFLAGRADLGTLAAIKILRDAWISPARRERFALEQRTLAHLDHPNIARLLDANTLADGTPFFIMEYVDGVPIDKYCDTCGCPISERLRLFRSVCEAVQFAHQHAVIHRDLKPSNILVKSDGTVKLLDFGISKHLDNLDIPLDVTRTGLRLLTPAYASPEQIRGERAAIQTDVYSLGVILYQLLTGRLPFDVSSRTPIEAVSMLTERDPVRPSLVALRVQAQLPDDRQLYAASDDAWADLDVLCLTAMHKDVRKRYGSAEALIRDIDHYLRGEPLEARPDTVGYRLGKFIRRNKRGVAAGAAAVVAFAGLIVFFTIRLAAERNAALAEAARTQRIQRFMLNLFQGGDDEAGPANDLRVATLIERGVQEARSLDQDPVVQAELYQTLGNIYQKLGSLDQAEALLHSALERRRSLGDVRGAGVADSLVTLGLLRVDQARLDEAERLVREGLEMSKRSLPPEHPAVAAATDALGRVLEEKGEYDEAIPVLEKAVRLRSNQDTPEADLASSLYELANVYFYAGRYQESEALNQRVLAMNRRIYGERHPKVAEVLVNLGAIKQDSGYYKEAEEFHRQSLQITRSFYGDDHYRTASSLTMVARALVFQKRLDEAVDLLRQALTVQERVFGKDHPRAASAVNELGNVAILQGRYDEAKAAFRRMAKIYRTVYAGKHYLIGTAVSNLGSAYMAEQDYPRAEGLFREALAMFSETLPPGHVNAAIARVKLGRTLLRQKRYAEAEVEVSEGYRVLTRQVNPSASWLNSARSDLTEIYEALQQPEKAAGLRQEKAVPEDRK
ncbi:MAG: tetratricopeptide repeat protein [Bryobacteraceae bacterium]|nr:serine/threonine-protein kinase [Bryobacterales bacterium]MEB2362012.1 tetratricopeptide repeat protein [Bryobacterales bacterium]NUN01984.1 tetratricopeptide repeat protein [Bryobacteraceae bacterium]